MNELKEKIADITGIKKDEEINVHTRIGCAIGSICAALLPTRDAIRSFGQFNTRIIQNFLLIWLDTNSDEVNNDSYCNTRTLRHIVNAIHTFTEVNACIKFISGIKEEKVFMVISGALSQTTMLMIHDIPQVNSIYIFCEDNSEHGLWVYKWSKIKGIFMDTLFLCEELKKATQQCDRNTIPMSFIEINNETSDQNLDKLDQSFVYTQILKEIVSTINFTQKDIEEFITYYRKHIVDNVTEQGYVDAFEREYHNHGPIWWYTSPCFLYSMLNRSLRTMEIDTIIKMSFLIHDLHQHITELHFIQNVGHNDATSFIVYRGQGMSQTDFDQLKKTQGGLLSFNNFLFTSKNHDMSLDFACQTIATPDLVGVLFVITIDPLIVSTPFANIDDVSCVQTEEDILFSIHSVFRIDQIKQINDNDNRLWQVDLTLIGENDPQLRTLIKCIRDETFPHRKGWCRWSELLIKNGEFIKAQQVCDTVITQTVDIDEKGFLNYQLGLIKFHQGKYVEATSFYNLSLKIREKILPPEHIDIAVCYNEIGLVNEKMGEYWNALSSLEKAFEIYEKTLSTNDSLLATCNNNIGRVCCRIGEYSKSIFYYEKALEIYENILPPNYANVITAYNNLGWVYEKMGEYKNAISFFERTLAILKKNLRPNHLDMADTYDNIGSVYEKMKEYSIAVSYYETALEIYKENLPSNESDLPVSPLSTGLPYFQRGPSLQQWKDKLEIMKKKL